MAGPIFRLPQLMAYTGLSSSAIYDRMDKDSPRYDSTFPKSFPLGGGAVGWFKDEVDAWLENCARTPQRGTSPEEQPVPSKQAATKVQSKPKSVALHARSETPTGESVTTPSTPSLQSNQTSAMRQPDLGVRITEGGIINANLIQYLSLDKWTPAMAALLVCGIKPSLGCKEIPAGGVGLDNKKSHSISERLRKAQRILKDWNDSYEENDPPPPDISPLDFIIWCDEEGIDTDWLRLARDLMGCPVSGTIDLTPSRFAMLISPPVHTVGRSANRASQGVDLPVTITTHSTKSRWNILDTAIDKAIALAGNQKTADVFMQLKKMTLEEDPPFTGRVEGEKLFYTNANNKEDYLSRSSLSSRLRRRPKLLP